MSGGGPAAHESSLYWSCRCLGRDATRAAAPAGGRGQTAETRGAAGAGLPAPSRPEPPRIPSGGGAASYGGTGRRGGGPPGPSQCRQPGTGLQGGRADADRGGPALFTRSIGPPRAHAEPGSVPGAGWLDREPPRAGRGRSAGASRAGPAGRTGGGGPAPTAARCCAEGVRAVGRCPAGGGSPAQHRHTRGHRGSPARRPGIGGRVLLRRSLLVDRMARELPSADLCRVRPGSAAAGPRLGTPRVRRGPRSEVRAVRVLPRPGQGIPSPGGPASGLVQRGHRAVRAARRARTLRRGRRGRTRVRDLQRVRG